MAELFLKQAKQYAEGRPGYPDELFRFIASKTTGHDLVWDVGTGTGQAARSLAAIYKNVIATDTSQKQLDFADKLPNVEYKCTSPNMSLAEVEHSVAAQGSVDLVTIAQAMHWFDLPSFYQQVKWVVKKPHGVIAAWCYTLPEVNQTFDSVFHRFYACDATPFWEAPRKMVDDKYTNIEFPFGTLDGLDNTGPFEFKNERLMDLDSIFTYVKSWSAYQTAKDKGIELLTDELLEDLKIAWNEDGNSLKLVKFPVYLRIGKVEN